VTRLSTVIIAFLLIYPSFAYGDIYRWVDDLDTIHYTDDVTNIPAPFRGKAERVIREGPKPTEASRGDSGETGKAGALPPPVTPMKIPPTGAQAGEKENIASEVEQLKAKIAAKEKLIQYVEDRQSLAKNPYRNRIVDPPDLELYKKYQEELPGDRERLKELESRR